MKVMGIDFGTKRVGLALSDERASIAFPHSVLSNNDLLLGDLVKLIKSEDVEKVVIGFSVNHLGGHNAIMSTAKKLALSIEKASGLKVFFQNESFSSVEAERFLNYGKPTTKTMRQKKNKQDLDASSAAIILQRYLDANIKIAK